MVPLPSCSAVTVPMRSSSDEAGKTNRFESLELAGVSSSSDEVAEDGRGGNGTASRKIAKAFTVDGVWLGSTFCGEGSSVDSK